MQRFMTDKVVSKTFTTMVLKGCFCAAIQFSILGVGGVLCGLDIDSESEKKCWRCLIESTLRLRFPQSRYWRRTW